ncbi:hypothetical protein CGI22_04750 [Vibrio parahaemolyticus]|uniref:hypothetical protein n=1 Tax=Vibrio parahaemolyticus TaxID=670 RepID=UPI001120D07D|nr:hypothetical protein [Vibrio parahaemolyticus]TOK27484.1 hypothetical protein CGI22_04750 [Vibrio parahaemolyticus]
MLEHSRLLEVFVDRFKGAACIRDYSDDSTLYANAAYSSLSGQSMTIKDALHKAESESRYRHISFCEYVENSFRKYKAPTFAIEFFEDVCFVTLRAMIKYNNSLAILTLIIEYEGDLVLEANDIHHSVLSKEGKDNIITSSVNTIAIEKRYIVDAFLNSYKDCSCIIIDEHIVCKNFSEMTQIYSRNLTKHEETSDSLCYIEANDNCSLIQIRVLIKYNNRPAFMVISSEMS